MSKRRTREQIAFLGGLEDHDTPEPAEEVAPEVAPEPAEEVAPEVAPEVTPEPAPAEEVKNAPSDMDPSATGIKFARMISEKSAKNRKYFQGKGVRY
jgi:hypothetical protein